MIRFDPDILVGYEVQMRSWGYLLQRAAVLGVDLCQQLSRIPGRPVLHCGWADCGEREVNVDLSVGKRRRCGNITELSAELAFSYSMLQHVVICSVCFYTRCCYFRCVCVLAEQRASGLSSALNLSVWLNFCPQMTPKRTASVQIGTSMELTP